MILDYPAKPLVTDRQREDAVSNRQAAIELMAWAFLFLVAGCLIGISCQMLG